MEEILGAQGWDHHRTDGKSDRQPAHKLTLLSPYVVIFSVWVVVGLRHCLLGCPGDRPSVQQLFVPPWHHAFGRQLLGLLGDATEFLGIRLLIGQHTVRGGAEEMIS